MTDRRTVCPAAATHKFLFLIPCRLTTEVLLLLLLLLHMLVLMLFVGRHNAESVPTWAGATDQGGWTRAAHPIF